MVKIKTGFGRVGCKVNLLDFSNEQMTDRLITSGFKSHKQDVISRNGFPTNSSVRSASELRCDGSNVCDEKPNV